MLSSKCALSNNKKFKFIREQQAKGLLSNLAELKIPILK